jgi:uncharacterized membrane protein
MLYALLNLVHVLSVVVWVGGMVFAHFCLRPALPMLPPPQRLPLVHAVMGRFFALVLAASLLAVGSGLWMMGRVARLAVQGGSSFEMPTSWLVMAVLGGLMLAIFGHIRFVLYRRLGQKVAAQDWPGGAAVLAQLRAWVAGNLAIGVVVIVVAVLRIPS